MERIRERYPNVGMQTIRLYGVQTVMVMVMAVVALMAVMAYCDRVGIALHLPHYYYYQMVSWLQTRDHFHSHQP